MAARTEDPGYRAESIADRATGVHDETKWAVLTTEFWAMVVLIIAILIAAAVSDTLEARAAWLFVTIVGVGYIVSRGIAKAGTGHEPGVAGRPRKR